MSKITNKPKPNPGQIVICAPPDKVEEITARTLIQPEVRAAATIQRFEGDVLDINCLVTELREQTAAIQSGDMSRAEAMLAAQVHTLDALFSNLARRAHSNMVAGYLDASISYLKLGLKAQAQSIRTVEALAELKYPKTVSFIGQANISSGHQQINNGAPPRAGENRIEPNKLSAGVAHELSPDTRAQSKAGGANQTMEAVGKVYGAKIARG